MTPPSAGTVVGPIERTTETARRLRSQSLVNLSRMGHCAPTVMQTLLDASGTEADWLIKLTAGFPGGIGNTGGECGGITAPLVLLGLRHARDPMPRGVPVVVYKGHDLLRRFTACNGTLLCRQIRGDHRLPLSCLGPIRHSPEEYVDCDLASDVFADVICGESTQAYGYLQDHLDEKGFHCAHAVLKDLRPAIPVTQELLDAASGFVGGTVFSGMTCSAFAAGVMALGLALGQIEHSRLRVMRMIGVMALGGDAFADDVNRFNRIMNLGHRLSLWFAAEFGDTQCRVLTRCDFSTIAGVGQYVTGDGVTRCRALAQQVALKVRALIDETRLDKESDPVQI